MFRRIYLVLILAVAGGAIFLFWPQRGLGAAPGPGGMPVPADGMSRFTLAQIDLTPVPTWPSPTATSSPTVTQTVFQFLPFIENALTPPLDLVDFYAHDETGTRRAAFQPGEPHTYLAQGVNNRTTPLTATLRIVQTSACGDSVLYNDTLILPPGDWQQAVSSPGLTCTGIYTTTVDLIYNNLPPSISTQHVVNPPSTVVVSGFQGFDRCHLPTVHEMQAWWDSSPYYVFNLYLGGISFFCWEEIPDPVWVHQVARQGWTFIQAWVGPQAPCSGFTHQMSADAGQAYLEGRAEASAAAEASRQAGLFENGVIYYDIEGYPNASSSCRNAVSAFLRGWTEQLHALGLRSGSYGSPCNSYMTDWASINPPPDDVWIAHWYRPGYDPAATVWDTPCLSNSLWANHRRIKQYAGDHVETWGGVSLEIDTDVLDGEITGLLLNLDVPVTRVPQVVVSQAGKPLSDLGLVGLGQGWVLGEGRLRWTADDGSTWVDITPPGFEVLDAEFLDTRRGWAFGWSGPGPLPGAARTVDGGASWSITPLPAGGRADQAQIQTGWLEALDDETAWVSVKLQSGGSFSHGRLFATVDGGDTWLERSLPFAAPVVFTDDQYGWITGGPAGDRLFHTQDGGINWSARSLDVPGDKQVRLGKPQFSSGEIGFLPAVLDGPFGPVQARFSTADSGASWQLQRDLDPNWVLAADVLLGDSVDGDWRARESKTSGLPSGTISFDFFDGWNGWAIVQQGSCVGKPNAVEEVDGLFSSLVSCDRDWRLIATQDGGLTWREILN